MWDEDDAKHKNILQRLAVLTQPLSSAPTLTLSTPPQPDPPLRRPTPNKPRHKQKHVVMRPTLGVGAGSLRPAAGCVCTIKGTCQREGLPGCQSVTLLIQP